MSIDAQTMAHRRSASGGAKYSHSRTPSSLAGLENSLGVSPQDSASFGKRSSTTPLLPGFGGKTQFGRTYRRLALLLAAAGALVCLTTHTAARQYESLLEYAHLENLRGASTNVSTLPGFPAAKQANEDTWRICPECSAQRVGGYLSSDHARLKKPSAKRLRSGRATKAELASFLLQDIVLASNLELPLLDWDLYKPETQFMQPEARTKLFHNYLTDPDSLLSFSFAGLRPSLPTLYMFTRTADHGRLSGTTRYKYMRRHVETVKAYQELVREEGYAEASQWRGKDRQLLWIVVEDESELDLGMKQVLQDSGIPYLYLAHGRTQYVLS